MKPLALGVVREVNPVPDADALVEAQVREQALKDALGAPAVESPPLFVGGRLRRWPAIVAVILALMVLVAVAVAAVGILTGSPYRAPSNIPINSNPRVGLGVALSRSAQVLPLRVPDPHGGPPWAMRALTTTRGLGCVQIGRIVNGQLGILGQDGVLGNDGRFHALPAELVQPWDCVTLDAHGQTFINIVRNDYASGPVLQRSCIALPQSSSERRCPAKDQRMLTYGLLGPKAASLTYLSGGRQVTTAPVGRQGAYLFVLSAGKTPQATGIISAGGGTGSSIDFPGLLKVTYKDGHTCRRAGPAPGSGRVCGPAGYVQTARTPRFSHVRVRSTIRRYLRGNGKSYADLRVMFRAPAAVTDANSGYTLAAKFPAPCNGIAGTNLARNVIRGEPITLDLQGLPGNCPGVAIAHLAFTGPGGSISILGGPAGPRQPLAGNTLLPGPEVASIATFKFRVPKTTGASESGGPIPRNRLPAWAK